MLIMSLSPFARVFTRFSFDIRLAEWVRSFANACFNGMLAGLHHSRQRQAARIIARYSDLVANDAPQLRPVEHPAKPDQPD